MATSRAQLFDAIRSAPGRADVRRVFGDFLQEQGDPWGELIAGQHCLALDRRDPARIKKEAALRAPFEERLKPDASATLIWWLGFVDAAHFAEGGGFENLLRDERGTVLRALQLQSSVGRGGAPAWLKVLEETGAPRLQALTIGGAFLGAPGSPEFGPLGRLWGSLPALTALEIRSQVFDLGEFELSPRLRRLALVVPPEQPQLWATLLSAHFPELERLVLWIKDAPTSVRPLADLLTPKRFPKLRELALLGFPLANAMAHELHAWEILPQLVILDISEGALNDGGAEGFLTHRAEFAHLRRLDVSGSRISLDVADRIGSLCPDVEAAAAAIVHGGRVFNLIWSEKSQSLVWSGGEYLGGTPHVDLRYRNRRWFAGRPGSSVSINGEMKKGGAVLKSGDILADDRGLPRLVFVDTAEAARAAQQ